MKQQLAFPEPVVVSDGPMAGSEPAVNFFRGSTRAIAVTSRNNVNDWYSRFPDPSGAFLGRLRSVKDFDHFSALDELFVHDLLSRQLDTVYEENGEGPDFRLYRSGDYIGGIEVLTLMMRNDWAGEQAQHDRIADELNKRLHANRWFIHFEILELTRSPAVSKLATWVQQTIKALPQPSEPIGREAELPTATYRDTGVWLRFEFLPRRPSPDATSDRIVGTGAIIGGLVNSRERLRGALRDKSGQRYSLRDKPFAPLVVIRDSFCDIDDVVSALYGSEQIHVESMRTIRANDGLFGRSSAAPTGKNRRVSCVFIVQNWQPWQHEEATILRLDNPFAIEPFPDDVLEVNYRFTEVHRTEQQFQLDWTPERPS
ncbi:hypothetical protein ACWCOV_26875 [Kribbella sp. NPDC002412]